MTSWAELSVGSFPSPNRSEITTNSTTNTIPIAGPIQLFTSLMVPPPAPLVDPLVKRAAVSHRRRSRTARGSSAVAQFAEIVPVDVHRGLVEVAVGLALEARVELLVVGRAKALVVADHALDRDPEAAAQPLGELQRGVELRRPVEDVAVAEADVLDSDRDVVEPDDVPAADRGRDELGNPAAAADRVVGADAR